MGPSAFRMYRNLKFDMRMYLSPLPYTLQAEGSSTASSGSQPVEGKGSQMGTVQPIPCLLSMPTRNHMDITTPPLPPVAPEVLRVAEHRHKKGLMYPYIFHVLTKVLSRVLGEASVV